MASASAPRTIDGVFVNIVANLILLAIASAIVAFVAYAVYVLLEALRVVIRVGMRGRWIDVVLGIVTGVFVLLVILVFLRSGTRSLFSEAASSVSNAPGP